MTTTKIPKMSAESAEKIRKLMVDNQPIFDALALDNKKVFEKPPTAALAPLSNQTTYTTTLAATTQTMQNITFTYNTISISGTTMISPNNNYDSWAYQPYDELRRRKDMERDYYYNRGRDRDGARVGNDGSAEIRHDGMHLLLDRYIVDQIVRSHPLVAAMENENKRLKMGPPPVHRAKPTGFNRYVNASDLMEEFIAYCGEHGTRQSEMKEMPVDLFIKWLIIRACEEDQEDPNVTLEIPHRKQPRCLGCQRYLKRDSRVPLHNDGCAARYFAKHQPKELVSA